MQNAIGLFENKTKKLLERALATKELFGNIKKAGKDMDGNQSDDEMDFVEALEEEMPTVDKETQIAIDEVLACQELHKLLETEKTIESMTNLKQQVEKVTKMVEEKEQLGRKLEPEVIQWDPLGKLVRRDEELDHIDSEIQIYDDLLNNEENFF